MALTLIKSFIPSSPLLLLLPVVIITIKLFTKSKRKAEPSLNLPPSPPRLPIINHLHLLGKLPHRSFHALSKTYGPIMFFHLGQAPTLVVSSMEIARQIFTTQDAAFANRAQVRAANILLYGCSDVGFSTYGEYWRQMRKLCVLELLSHKKVQSFRSIREEEVAELIESIRVAWLEGAPINPGQLLLNTSISIIWRSALGRKYDRLGDDKRKFGDLSRRAFELLGAFCFGDFFHYLGWMDIVTGLVKRLRETAEGLDAFLDQVIEEHRNTQASEDQLKGKCFVAGVLQHEKGGLLEANLTQDNLKAVILDMFLGGTDTVSTTLEWAMVRLMQNPAKMRKAQEEVRRVMGKKAKVEEENVLQMDYLKCIIKETLRLHAPAPFLAPRELTQCAKLQGYDIPPKTRIFINVFAIHRDPTLWDSQEEFLPERFLNNQLDFKGQHFQFIPFGAGRRGCPGLAFGAAEAEYVLANLLYWFDWKLPSGTRLEDLDMTEKYGLIVHKKVPLQLIPELHYPL